MSFANKNHVQILVVDAEQTRPVASPVNMIPVLFHKQTHFSLSADSMLCKKQTAGNFSHLQFKQYSLIENYNDDVLLPKKAPKFLIFKIATFSWRCNSCVSNILQSCMMETQKHESYMLHDGIINRHGNRNVI